MNNNARWAVNRYFALAWSAGVLMGWFCPAVFDRLLIPAAAICLVGALVVICTY
jgi:hypothetical protein